MKAVLDPDLGRRDVLPSEPRAVVETQQSGTGVRVGDGYHLPVKNALQKQTDWRPSSINNWSGVISTPYWFSSPAMEPLALSQEMLQKLTFVMDLFAWPY